VVWSFGAILKLEIFSGFGPALCGGGSCSLMGREKNSEARRANNSFKINLLKAHSGSLC
jgi:hypothetical protein